MPPVGRGQMTTERAKNFGPTIARLIRYLGQQKFKVLAGIIFAISSVAFNIYGPKVLGTVTTDLFNGLVASVTGTGGIDFDTIAHTLLFLLGLYLVASAANLAQGWLMTSVTQNVCHKLRQEIAEKIQRIPLSHFNKQSKGDVLSRLTNDVDTLGQSLNQSISQLITSIAQIIGVLIMMISINLTLTGVTVLTLPVSLVVVSLLVRFSQRYFKQQQKVLGEVNGIVEEDIAGQNVIVLFNKEQDSVRAFAAKNDQLYQSAWKSQFFSGLMMPLMNIIGNMGYVGVVVVGAKMALAGTGTPGDITSFTQYIRNFTQPIQQLATVSNTLQAMAAATERVFEFLDAPEELPTKEPKLPAKREGRVRFDHVRFGYNPDEPIIHDLNLEVESGKTIAIVGPTGAGKTTIIKLLQRFYDVDSGSLSVDGIDVREWDRDELRQEFAMVLQDSWLFTGTIRENIRYGRPDATDEEVEAAAKAARCDHFIRTLKDGYDFVINEDATNISQGQRQLITIARAVLANRPALILDEATSNVDTRTEELIQRAMDHLMEGRTSFVIAHRLSTIREADIILVLDHGDVVESGTHEELLAQGGFYAKLYESQFEEVDAA